MPLRQYQCLNGHTRDIFLHTWHDQGARAVMCPSCRHSMGPVLSVGYGLTWFEEGRARVIYNLGQDPVTITSHRQHERLMKQHGVTWAPARRGLPGCWGG